MNANSQTTTSPSAENSRRDSSQRGQGRQTRAESWLGLHAPWLVMCGVLLVASLGYAWQRWRTQHQFDRGVEQVQAAFQERTPTITMALEDFRERMSWLENDLAEAGLAGNWRDITIDPLAARQRSLERELRIADQNLARLKAAAARARQTPNPRRTETAMSLAQEQQLRSLELQHTSATQRLAAATQQLEWVRQRRYHLATAEAASAAESEGSLVFQRAEDRPWLTDQPLPLKEQSLAYYRRQMELARQAQADAQQRLASATTEPAPRETVVRIKVDQPAPARPRAPARSVRKRLSSPSVWVQRADPSVRSSYFGYDPALYDPFSPKLSSRLSFPTYPHVRYPSGYPVGLGYSPFGFYPAYYYPYAYPVGLTHNSDRKVRPQRTGPKRRPPRVP